MSRSFARNNHQVLKVNPRLFISPEYLCFACLIDVTDHESEFPLGKPILEDALAEQYQVALAHV